MLTARHARKSDDKLVKGLVLVDVSNRRWQEAKPECKFVAFDEAGLVAAVCTYHQPNAAADDVLRIITIGWRQGSVAAVAALEHLVIMHSRALTVV